jgi:hypothetical protein
MNVDDALHGEGAGKVAPHGFFSRKPMHYTLIISKFEDELTERGDGGAVPGSLP